MAESVFVLTMTGPPCKQNQDRAHVLRAAVLAYPVAAGDGEPVAVFAPARHAASLGGRLMLPPLRPMRAMCLTPWRSTTACPPLRPAARASSVENLCPRWFLSVRRPPRLAIRARLCGSSAAKPLAFLGFPFPASSTATASCCEPSMEFILFALAELQPAGGEGAAPRAESHQSSL